MLRASGGAPSIGLGLKFGPPVSSDISAPTGKAREIEGDEALDTILIPDPTPLEVGQLNDAFLAIIEQLMQIKRIGLKYRTGHVV
jgi:hypothetical protein